MTNSYGFNGNPPQGAVFAEYDYLNAEFTGRFFTEIESYSYKETYIDGEIHLGLEAIDAST